MPTYITTPIFYVNAQPHLGHTYTTVIADAAHRYARMCGKETRFQTGTDEHGDKIAQAAEAEGISPREYADRISAVFHDTWPLLTIKPDRFIRTTDTDHIATVQMVLQQVYDNDDIYFSEYEGLYCVGCERFLTEKELVDGKCADHRKTPEKIAEQNYFFRMGKYQDWLVEHIKGNPDFITPQRYRNEILAMLSEPLEDLCISRPTSRLTWGIPLPFDENFVTYVWFDALINYLTGLGYPDSPDFKKFWPGAEHVIGKDILKPHAIFWPTMLRAMGLAPYKSLHVHGHWNVDDTKMSKSLGNVVRPGDMIEKYGADASRYFLLRDMAFGVDSSFSYEAANGRYNSDLANDLGNLFSRSLTMAKNFCAGMVPPSGDLETGDLELKEAAVNMVAAYKKQMQAWNFHRGLAEVWLVIGMANRYIVTNAPWELAKKPEQRPRLDTVINTLLKSLRLITICLFPVMPAKARDMWQALGQTVTSPEFTTHGQWDGLAPGTGLAVPTAMFPRLDKPTHTPAKKNKKEKTADDGLLDFNEFARLDLRIAEIKAAERIKKSDRLLRLTVLAPEERTVVAGIAGHYSPEELIGRQVIMVVNLKPARLMGVESRGMVLAVKDGEDLVLTGPATDVTPGSRVS